MLGLDGDGGGLVASGSESGVFVSLVALLQFSMTEWIRNLAWINTRW